MIIQRRIVKTNANKNTSSNSAGSSNNNSSNMIIKPQPQPEPSPEPQPSGGGTVYWTANGKKYHSNPGCSNMNSPSSGIIEKSGRTPCKKCY